MLGVHASGVCTGISARQEQIGRDVADGRRFRGKKLTSLPVQKHRGEQGHTHRDEHTVMKTRCPGHAGPEKRYQSGATDRRGRPQRTHITNPHK